MKKKLLFMLLLLASSISEGGAAEIVFRAQVIPKGSMIRLGDMADISAATPERMHDLMTTPLLPVPAPGTVQYMQRNALRDLLASRGVDTKDLFFGGATVIEIGDAVKKTIKQKEQKEKIVQPKIQEEAKLPISKAVVVLRKIGVGELVRESDVELRAHPGALPSNALSSLSEAVGMEARRQLPVGYVLRKNQLRAPLQVLRGETVTVFARTGGVSVKTFAIAKQDGAQGDLIRVQALDKKELYMAHVSGRRELEVLATGHSAQELATLERRSARR